MALDEDDLQKGLEKAEAKQLIREREDRNQQYRNELLDHSSYLEDIRDGILRIQRREVIVTPDMDSDLQEPIIKEYVRMPDGNWLPFDHVRNNDDLWKRLTEDGIGEKPEQVAKTVVNHLSGNANMNIATSKLDSSDDIPTIGRDSEMALERLLKSKRDELGITTSEATYIVRSIVHPNVRAVLGKSEGGGFVKQILSSMKMIWKDDGEENDGRSIVPKPLR